MTQHMLRDIQLGRPLQPPTMTRTPILPAPQGPLRLRPKQHPIPNIHHQRILNQGSRVPRELPVYGVMEEVVIEIFLLRKLEHERVRHAFAKGLPGAVLPHSHAEHIRFPRIWVQTFCLEGLEGVEVGFEGGPGDFGPVFEEDYVGDCGGHGGCCWRVGLLGWG